MSFKVLLNEFEANNFEHSFVKQLDELLTGNFKDASKQIYEFDIQLIEHNESDDKIIWEIVQSNYLLLNKQYVKSVYFYARETFLKSLHSNENNNEKELDALSLLILMVNPNFSTAWSYRKTIYLKYFKENNESAIEREFYLNKLVLNKHFKCEQAFVHRRWMIKLKHDSTSLETFLFDELDFLLGKLIKRVKANYYCWTFANWLFEFALNSVNNKTFINTFLHEQIFLNKSKSLLYENPSDFCVFHFRLQLFKLFYLNLNDSAELLTNFFQKFVFEELELAEDLLLRYANYSTVWNYLKYFFIFANHLMRVSNLSEKIVDQKEILNQSWSRLKESFSSNSKAVFSHLFQVNVNEQVHEQFTTTNTLLKSLMLRELRVSESVAKLFESNNRDSSQTVQIYSEKFTQYINRFILSINY